MVTAAELGYKPGEAEVRENAPYRVLRPQFETVISPAEVLRKRFGELQSFAQKYKGRKWAREDFERECPWNNNYFSTSMGVAGTSQWLILNYGSEALHSITSETTLVEHGIPMVAVPPTAKRYNRAAVHNNRPLTENEVAENPFWLELAEGDRGFLGQFAQLTFKALRDVYEENKGMSVYPSRDKQLIERALVLLGVGRSIGCASAVGHYYLDGYARIVGTPRTRAQSAEDTGGVGTAPKTVISYTSADVEAARQELAQLRAVAGTDKVASLDALLRKLL